jgi:Domain of unknown function (DUF4062)
MKSQVAAMEYFGSRGDEASAICLDEIEQCDVFVGIWRYGWQPSPSEPSITEQEFDHARSKGRVCLCYVVDDEFPWIPAHVDHGEPAVQLMSFKKKTSMLVRSKFTTPDNLAKQIAADLAKVTTDVSANSFGGLLRVNWEVFAPELQVVLSSAYSQARVDGRDGVVATRHVIAALAGLPNTGQALVTAFPNVDIPALKSSVRQADVAEMYLYDRPVSACVLGSMNRLLPKHSTTQQLLAIELAVDLLKNGHGRSVAKFRAAGVDANAVASVDKHIRQIAQDGSALQRGLGELSDAEIIHLAYITNLSVPAGLGGKYLREFMFRRTRDQGVALFLAGELLRRHPRLLGL